MALNEADTRAKLIDPVLHSRGWTEDLIRREETAQGIDIVEGKPRRRQRGRTDYLLRVRVNANSQPVAIALLEAKRSDEPPDKGLEQAKEPLGWLSHRPVGNSISNLSAMLRRLRTVPSGRGMPSR